jgi:phosphomannomutase
VVEVTGDARLRVAVEAWIADDPDAGDRDELRALLDRAFGGAGSELEAAGVAGAAAEATAAAGAAEELQDRFAGRLRFGTAGLRGAVAAGPNRMNRAVVRAATAAVADWLLAASDGAAGDGAAGPGAGVVVGGDARHRSADFADERARASRCTCCRGRVLLPCSRSRSVTWAPQRA